MLKGVKHITGLLILLLNFSIAAFSDPPAAPYIAAGLKVEASYKGHVRELTPFYDLLKSTLQKEAPDLVAKLSPEAPKAIAPGYQLLPTIIEAPLKEEPRKEKTLITIFSWVKTGDWLKSERAKLSAKKNILASISEQKSEAEKRKVLEGLIADYLALNRSQKVINSQIEYNKIWQRNFVNLPKQYEENTKLYERLNNKETSPEEIMAMTLKKLMGSPGPWVEIKENSSKGVILQVHMLTDIEDDEFLNQFKKAVQKFWTVQADKKYSLELDIQEISPAELYKESSPPKKGDPIDLGKHIPRFPLNRAILTTGSGTHYYTMTEGRPYVVLSGREVSETVVSHEFGHLLQINDAYFRAKKDIGENGFEIIEVVPDLTDIMSAPGMGRVKKHHFDLVLDSIKNQPTKAKN